MNQQSWVAGGTYDLQTTDHSIIGSFVTTHGKRTLFPVHCKEQPFVIARIPGNLLLT